MATELIVALAGCVFCIGALGATIRKNSIVVFMCIELMLNSANLAFVAIGERVGNLDGQVAVFFVMVVAAAEAAVGLAIIISTFRATRSVDTVDSQEMFA